MAAASAVTELLLAPERTGWQRVLSRRLRLQLRASTGEIFCQASLGLTLKEKARTSAFNIQTCHKTQKIILAPEYYLGATCTACTMESVFKMKCKNCKLSQHILVIGTLEREHGIKYKIFLVVLVSLSMSIDLLQIIRKFMRNPFQNLVKKEDLKASVFYNNFERGIDRGKKIGVESYGHKH